MIEQAFCYDSNEKAPATRKRPGAWTDLCWRPIMSKRTYRIRSLRPGDRVPESEPRRYPNSSGYIRLRWRVAPYEYVEAYEHRVFDGFVTTADHVHHIDHDPSNNDPSNLRPVSIVEHGRQHRLIDRDEIAELYEQGLSTPAIGRKIGRDHGAIHRALVAEGVQPRSLSEAAMLLRLPLDEAKVIRLHKAGVRVRRIAGALGVSPDPVGRIVREAGLPPHRPGRPSDDEIGSALEALRAEGLS